MWFHGIPPEVERLQGILWNTPNPVKHTSALLDAGNGRTDVNRLQTCRVYRVGGESGARLESEDETKGIGTARSRVSPS